MEHARLLTPGEIVALANAWPAITGAFRRMLAPVPGTDRAVEYWAALEALGVEEGEAFDRAVESLHQNHNPDDYDTGGEG